MAIIQDPIEPRCKTDSLCVRQLLGDSNYPARAGCISGGKSLSSYSAEEIAKKHDEPVFRCLITFLESRDMPSESDLILMGPEEKCYFLDKGKFKVDSKVGT